MTPLRLAAVFLIFITAVIAWVVLGTTNLYRTEEGARTGTEKVAGLFGRPQTQHAPRFALVDPAAGDAVELASSDIRADFELDQRRKGLLWFSTYRVTFDARYGVRNTSGGASQVEMRLAFPTPDGTYDLKGVRVDGQEVPVEYRDGLAVARFLVPAGSVAVVETGYKTGGMDRWSYVPAPDGGGIVRDFSLVMGTDFANIDFADESVSPTSKQRTGDGWRLQWAFDNVVSGKPATLVMPKPLNPGPLAYRISYFAPVSLLFFFAGLVLLTATRDVRLHPMHYGFLAAAFFAFHLLFSYLADQIAIGWAFGVAASTSVALVVGYLRGVLGRTRVLAEIAVSQLVFLVLFSYSFFFEGLTGLAVTVGSVLTLGYFMAKTARLDWEKVLGRSRPDVPPAPVDVAVRPAPSV